MNSFEIDVEALRKARRELAAQLHDLGRHLNAARDLINSVPQSRAPKPDLVANAMHELYRDKADADAGVRGLLENYIAEVTDMINLLDATERTYTGDDAEARRRVHTAGGGGALT